jgi:hypothetical protein
MNKRARISITNESNGVWIKTKYINKYVYTQILPILKTVLLDIKTQKYGNLKNASSSNVVELRQYDPWLFGNLLHGKKYSRIVQKHKQPIIISEEEYKATGKNAIPAESKSKYINITTGRPAYYSCHTNKFGNISLYYITGKHIDGWCIPGCRPKKWKKEDSILEHKRSVCET